jgi:hypothetical protein
MRGMGLLQGWRWPVGPKLVFIQVAAPVPEIMDTAPESLEIKLDAFCMTHSLHISLVTGNLNHCLRNRNSDWTRGKATLCSRFSVMFSVLSTMNLFQKEVLYINKCTSKFSVTPEVQWEVNVWKNLNETVGFFCMTMHLHISHWWSSTHHIQRLVTAPKCFLFLWLKGVLKGHSKRELLWRKYCANRCRVTYFWVMNQFWELFEATCYVFKPTVKLFSQSSSLTHHMTWAYVFLKPCKKCVNRLRDYSSTIFFNFIYYFDLLKIHTTEYQNVYRRV